MIQIARKSALVFLAGLLASVAGPLAVQAAPAAHVYLQPSQLVTARYADGAFDVQVRLSGLNHHGRITYDDDRDTVPDRAYESNGLGAYEIKLLFNPGVVKVVEAEPGDFAGSTGRNVQCFERNSTPGEYELGCASLGSADGPQGSGRLATITLRPLANGVTPLALEAGLGGPLGDEIPVRVTGTMVRVSGAPTMAPTPGPSPTPGPATGDRPSVIGDGELGDIDLPEGDTGQANPADLDSGAQGSTSGDDDFPSAGVGYREHGTEAWPVVLGGGLAAAGAALLAAGSWLASRSRRL